MDLSYPTQPNNSFDPHQPSFHSHDLLSQLLHKQALVNSFHSTNCTTATAQMQHSSITDSCNNNSLFGVPDDYALAVAAVLGMGKKSKGAGMNKRKRKSSQAPPIKVLTANASNFRHIVHSLTGFPQSQPQSQSMDRETSPLSRTLPPIAHLLPFVPFNNTLPKSSLDAHAYGLTEPMAIPSPFSSSVVDSLLDSLLTSTVFAASNIEPLPDSFYSS